MGIPKGGGFAHWSPMLVSEGLTNWKCFERGGAVASAPDLAQSVAAQTAVIPAKSGYPVRRSLGDSATTALEYWLTRFRG
jgi:hypothetical protein